MSNNSIERPLATIARAGVFVLLSSSIAYALKFVSRVLLARFLGPIGFGQFSVGMAIYALLTLVAGLGIPIAVTKLIPAARARGRDPKYPASVALFATVLSSTVVMFLAVVSLDWLAHAFNVPTSVIVPFVLVIVFDLALSTLRSISIGYGDVWVQVWLTDIGLALLYLVLVAGSSIVFGSPVATAYAFFISVLFLALIALTYCIRNGYVSAVVPDPASLCSIVRYSLPFLVMSVSGLVFTWTDSLIIAHFLNAAAVGLYRSAATLVRVVTFVVSAITVLFLPVASSLYAKGDFNALTRVYTQVLRWIAVVSAPISVLLVLFGRQALYYLFGSEFLAAYPVLVILTVFWFFIYLFSVSNQMLIAVGQQKRVSISLLLAAVANVVLDIVAVRPLGIAGVALATGVSLLVANLYFFFCLWKARIRADPRAFLAPIAVAAASAVPVWVIAKYLSGVPAIVIGLCMYSALYMLLVLSFRILKVSEVMKLLDILRGSTTSLK